jgi:hypothetical protein
MLSSQTTSVERQTSDVERSTIGVPTRGVERRGLGVECWASNVERRPPDRKRWRFNVKHREFQHRASSVPASSMGRSSRASAPSQRPTVDCREDRRGPGKVTSSQGYSDGSIECRASSVLVKRRASSIPTSSVGHSSRASASGQRPTVDCREDGRGDGKVTSS